MALGIVWEDTRQNFSVADAAKNWIVHVPTLRNPQHERFAQELATGKTADAAYVLAGYQENRSNAARLNASQNIQRRVAEIQSIGAELAAITVEGLIAEAEAARTKAMAEKSSLIARRPRRSGYERCGGE